MNKDALVELPGVRNLFPRVRANPRYARPISGSRFRPAEPASRLRVCILAACPFPANHGTPGSIREISEALSDLGHDIHIVTYHFGEDIPLRGPRLHRIADWTGESSVVVGPTKRRPLYDLQMVFTTLQVIRRHRPHLIHAHGYEAALIAWLCRRVSKLPVIYSGHNTMSDELPSYNFIRPRWAALGLAKALDAVVPRLADRCLPHSANMAKFFEELGLNGRAEAIVNFGIDLDWMDQSDGAAIRRQYKLGDARVLVYSGVLDEFQRLDLLFEAFSHLSLYEPDAKLMIVVTIASARQLTDLDRRTRNLGIAKQVIVTEPQALERVRDFLAAADVAVVPRPRAPGFPIKLLNYWAARKPVVLFASSASHGLRNQENAVLAAPDTGMALGEALLEVLRDPQLRQRLADNGYRFVRQNHDRRVVAEQICSCYRRVLQAKNKLQEPRIKFQEGSYQ